MLDASVWTLALNEPKQKRLIISHVWRQLSYFLWAFPAQQTSPLLSRHKMRLRLYELYNKCGTYESWSQVLHGFPPANGELLTGVAGVVPRRWERKRLLIDAIRLKPDRTSRRGARGVRVITSCQRCTVQDLPVGAANGNNSDVCTSSGCWCRSWSRSRSRSGWDWSLYRDRCRSRGRLALTGPAPKRLRLSAARSGTGPGTGSGDALPHCAEDMWDVRSMLTAQSVSDEADKSIPSILVTYLKRNVWKAHSILFILILSVCTHGVARK